MKAVCLMLVRILVHLSTEYCTSSFRQVGNAVFGKYLASQGSSLVLSNPGSMLYNIHH